MTHVRLSSLFVLSLCAAASLLRAETPVVPDWALPGSATHQQVPPPAGFTRASTTIAVPLGIFEGQTDVGSALVPGSASYDAKSDSYTITSAGYNIWYFRDEFRFLWKKMSGDVSIAADLSYPDPKGYFDRKAVLVIRQDLDDNSKEVMTALHGAGLIHLAQRPEKGADLKEDARVEAKDVGPSPRIGIEKHGDTVTLYVSLKGEPMHPIGKPAKIHFDGPFYVGIGFTSHQPVTSDTGVVSKLVLENEAGKVK